jgi:acyl-CoA-binding protein
VALKEEFETAAKEIHQITYRPSNEDLLALYAFYKQATEGDVKGSRPGMLDLKGRKKYDSWAERKGMPAEKAMQEYVALVQRLKTK